MNIEILSSLSETEKKRSDSILIGTHNGIFHSDEVTACAMLCLINSSCSNIQILRTRDASALAKCDICVDIGGGDFDHHQSGFNKTRDNGIKYASAGLVWNAYGKRLIDYTLHKYFSPDNCNINDIFKIFNFFDNNIITLVDCEDNGILSKSHCFSFIPSFLPLWFNNSPDYFNNQFYMALVTTIVVLEQELKTIVGKEIAKNRITYNWKSQTYFNNGILEIPSQTIDWVETVININMSTLSDKINFVIFPYPDGGWAAQCVPPSITNKFAQRITFPTEWAGQTDKLPEISNVKGATFCHNGRFFIKATNKEAIIQMCIIATNSAK